MGVGKPGSVPIAIGQELKRRPPVTSISIACGRDPDVRERASRALSSEGLPQTHLSGGSKDMILAVIGLLTLLLALVLGTLVGDIYAFFAMQKSELETMASRALLVDQALAEYGPEAKPARNLMKQALTQSYDLFWRGADADATQSRGRSRPLGAGRERARRARSKTPAQKDALAAAKANLRLMEQTRLLMSLQLSSPVAWSLVTSVILGRCSSSVALGFSRGPIRRLSSRWRSARFRWRARCS